MTPDQIRKAVNDFKAKQAAELKEFIANLSDLYKEDDVLIRRNDEDTHLNKHYQIYGIVLDNAGFGLYELVYFLAPYSVHMEERRYEGVLMLAAPDIERYFIKREDLSN